MAARQRRPGHRVEVPVVVLGADRVGHHEQRCTALCTLLAHAGVLWVPQKCTDPEAAIRDATSVDLLEVRPATPVEVDTAVYRPHRHDPWTVTWARTVTS